MPIYQDESGIGPAVEVEFGVGDVGFRIGVINNYPGENGYEQRACFEVHRLKEAYGAGTSIGNSPEEAQTKFQCEVAPVVMTFPANDPTSLDVLIRALQTVRDQVYVEKFYAVVYADMQYDALIEGFTICDSYDKAKKTLEDLVMVQGVKREILAIAEVFGTSEDFVARENSDYLFVKHGKCPKVKIL